MKQLRTIREVLLETWKEFREDNVMHYAASLSYYTIFSLPPIIVIVIAVAGTIFGEDAVSGRIYNQIADLVGHDSALQIQGMVETASKSKNTFWAKIIGLVTLVVAATGVFVEMQSTLNTIWDVKAKPKNNFVKLIKDRLLSFAMVLVISFLLLVSLIIQASISGFENYLESRLPEATLIMIKVFNFVLSLVITTLLFGLIFKFLPDVKIQWRDVAAGAFVTAALFTLGKFLIGFYLGKSNIASTYGAAGTIVIILAWVFYSSILLFLGAEFTQVYATRFGTPIHPSDYAVRLTRKFPEAREDTVS